MGEPNDLGYAKSLMLDNDYFRAISVYKEIEYNNDNDSIKTYCRLQIAKAFFKSEKYKSSIQYLSRVLNQPTASLKDKQKANINMGIAYYKLKVFPLALNCFTQTNDSSGYAMFYSALIDIETENTDSALSKYRYLTKPEFDLQLREKSSQLATIVQNSNTGQRKSPFTAAAMSTIIPGSGQIYCKHYYDAMQAFLFVSSFAFASSLAYRYDHSQNTGYATTYIALSITAMFHFGNIIGASRTAKYNNYRAKEAYMSQFRDTTLSIDY
jgi:tetratricopeptide (TPR) repeat protein